MSAFLCQVILLIGLLLVPSWPRVVALVIRNDVMLPQVIDQTPEHILAEIEKGEETLVVLLLRHLVDVDWAGDGSGGQGQAEKADQNGGEAGAAAAAPAAPAAAAAAAASAAGGGVVAVDVVDVVLAAAAAHDRLG